MYKADEQETIINIFPMQITKQAEIYTCIPAMMRKLRTLAAEYPEEVSIVDRTDDVSATVPVSWVKVAPKRKCNLTDEQKRANAERLAAYRKAASK